MTSIPSDIPLVLDVDTDTALRQWILALAPPNSSRRRAAAEGYPVTLSALGLLENAVCAAVGLPPTVADCYSHAFFSSRKHAIMEPRPAPNADSFAALDRVTAAMPAVILPEGMTYHVLPLQRVTFSRPTERKQTCVVVSFDMVDMDPFYLLLNTEHSSWTY